LHDGKIIQNRKAENIFSEPDSRRESLEVLSRLPISAKFKRSRSLVIIIQNSDDEKIEKDFFHKKKIHFTRLRC